MKSARQDQIAKSHLNVKIFSVMAGVDAPQLMLMYHYRARATQQKHYMTHVDIQNNVQER
jgi:hypothetical protein